MVYRERLTPDLEVDFTIPAPETRDDAILSALTFRARVSGHRDLPSRVWRDALDFADPNDTLTFPGDIEIRIAWSR